MSSMKSGRKKTVSTMRLLHFFLGESQPKLSFATVGEGTPKVYLCKNKQNNIELVKGLLICQASNFVLLPMILLFAAVKHRR